MSEEGAPRPDRRRKQAGDAQAPPAGDSVGRKRQQAVLPFLPPRGGEGCTACDGGDLTAGLPM